MFQGRETQESKEEVVLSGQGSFIILLDNRHSLYLELFLLLILTFRIRERLLNYTDRTVKRKLWEGNLLCYRFF